MSRSRKRRWIIAVGIGLAGAGAIVGGVMPQLAARPQGTPPQRPDVEVWQQAWSDVLTRRVDRTGRVDFSMPASDRAKLDAIVGFVAAVDPVSSPALFPGREARLAYYINAYNALAMYGILDAGVPQAFNWFGRLRFFVVRKFIVGGRSMSLYSLENDVIRPLGDPRVHFALNCMTVSCPRLPRHAFTARSVDAQLDAAARDFVEDSKNVKVDTGRREVHVSAIFKFYTKDFLAQSPSLVGYINRYRTSRIPPDYKVLFMDYDWTVNDQTRLGSGSNH